MAVIPAGGCGAVGRGQSVSGPQQKWQSSSQVREGNSLCKAAGDVVFRVSRLLASFHIVMASRPEARKCKTLQVLDSLQ